MNDPILFDPESSTCSTESSVSRSTEGSSTKRARIDTQAALIELAQQRVEIQRDNTKKHLEHLDNQRKILREIADDNKTIIQDNKNIIEDNKRFQKEFMDFLRTKK
ncbi:hypothetical protein ACLKA7_000877 [Drosophila subpalustris]